MHSVTRQQCLEILTSYFGSNNFELDDFFIKSAEASLGLMSSVGTLYVKVRCLNGVQEAGSLENKQVRFFIKFLPQNEYHLNLVTTANCFKKESAFFGSMFSGLRKYLLYKSVPECYLKDCETMIVLEDLTLSGFRNCSNPVGFDLEHTYASVKALADIHASSLLYEHECGRTLDKMLSEEILRPWFSPIEGYSGYKDNLAAAEVVGRIIDKYFSKYSLNIRNKAKTLCKDFSKNMQMSKKYRNVLTHQDLWCNNVMFSYDTAGKVNDAVIIDFQMYGYNPPSLDLLIMICCNTDKVIRKEHMDQLLDYYYTCLRNCISHHKVDPDNLLTWSEFKASMEESLPTALTAAPLYLHTVLTPEEEMFPVINDVERFKVYMEEDRSIILVMLDKYGDYRDRVLIAVEELLNFVSSKDRIEVVSNVK